MRIVSCIIACILGAAIYYGLYPWMLHLVKKVDERIIADADEEEQFLLENDFLIRGRMTKQILFAVFGGLIALGLTWYYGFSPKMITVFAFDAVLAVLTLVDFVRMEIPVVLNYVILGIGLISIATVGEPNIVSRLIGVVCISLPMFLIAWVIPGGFGLGDVKLMCAAGVMLGASKMVVAFFIALMVGGLYGIIMLIRRKKHGNDHFAFGPCLSVGLMVAAVFGNQLMQIYLEAFLAR